MKLYRYCGQEEVNNILNGQILKNNTDWSEDHDSTSKGFCFFAYNKSNDLKKIITNSLTDWLDGIVNNEYLVEIEIDKARKARGFYASGFHTEFNLTEYSIKNVKAIYKVIKLDVKDWVVKGDYYYTYTGEKIF